MKKKQILAGWGKIPSINCSVYRPEKQRELAEIINERTSNNNSHSLIARGLGRSYGDASLQPHGVIKTERLDSLINFDPESGILTAQAGLSLAEIMKLFIPRGFLPPVIPGTKYVTLGGAFACNIHGKNQFKLGEFAEHVTKIKLLLPDGSRAECSQTENRELFLASAGGMGMTGIIEEISIRLMKIYSTSLNTQSLMVDSIEEMLGCFSHHKNSADYMIGWIDHMATGDKAGRGVFEAAKHITASEGGTNCLNYHQKEPRLSINFNAPSFLLNKWTMSIYNNLRFAKYHNQPKNNQSKNREGYISKRTDFESFFHPLDAIGNWNNLYGKGGFYQYQCLLPESEHINEYMRELLVSLHEEKIFSFLAVIKYHRSGIAPLSFSKSGYSLALDLPNNARVRAVIPQINRWIAERKGRVYLAKDALLSTDMFEKMYGEEGKLWQSQIRQLDKENILSSMMSERLKWK